MKKRLYILLALLPLVSCTKDEPSSDAKTQELIFVEIDGAATKTESGTNGKIAWSAGDKVGVFSEVDKKASAFSLKSGAGFTVASFTGSPLEGEKRFVFHPADARCDGNSLRTELPSEVMHSVPFQALENMPMFGHSDNNSHVSVRNLCGILRFNLKGNGYLRTIELEAETPIAGDFRYILSDDLYAMGANSTNRIVMDASETELNPFRETPFLFVLPCGEYQNLKFVVTGSDGVSTVFSSGETVTVEAGKISEAASVAPDVELLQMSFADAKNASGFFWYTELNKNASFCVSYTFAIAQKEEFEKAGSDAATWLAANGRLCTSSITDMHILTPETEYVAMAQAVSVSGSKDAPIVREFKTPAVHYDASMALSVAASNIKSDEVTYTVNLPEEVEYLSEVKVLPEESFNLLSDNGIILDALPTRRKDRSLTGTFTGLLPGIEYVIYCVCDNEVSISKPAVARFTTLGSKIGGGTEDLDEFEIK